MIALFEQVKTVKLRENCRHCGSLKGVILSHHWHNAIMRCGECDRYLRFLNKADFKRAKELNLINYDNEK